MGALARVVAELHAEPSLHHQKHFVFIVVVMPNELALELNQLDELSIEFAGNVWLPVLVDEGEFVGKVHSGGHNPKMSLQREKSQDLQPVRASLSWFSH